MLLLSRPRALLLACTIAGIAGAGLLRGVALGVNVTLFAVVVAALHASFTRAPSPLRRRILAAVLPALASAPAFLRDSEWSRAFAVPMTLAWMLFVPRLVESGASLDVFADVPDRARAALRRAFPALRRSIELPLASARDPDARGTLRTTLVGLALGIPSAVVFMTLFSFDAKFSRALARVAHGSDGALGFVSWAAFCALALLVLVTVDELRPRSADAAAASDSSSGGAFPYRAPLPDGDVPLAVAAAERAPWRFRVPAASWPLVLLQVAGVFAFYLALHATDLFAGHARPRFTPGVTYAGDVHAGFFALLVAVGLAVGLVLVGHALFAGERATSSVRMRRGMAITEVLLLALTAPTLASCAQKLALYVDAYGATFLRLAVALAIVVTFPILVLTAVKTLRPSWTRFGACAALTAVTCGTAAGFFDADAYIARVNVTRALAGALFDPYYLASLGSSAFTGLDAAKPAAPDAQGRWRVLVHSVLVASEPAPAYDWRAWRLRTRCEDALGAAVCADASAHGLRHDAGEHSAEVHASGFASQGKAGIVRETLPVAPARRPSP